MAVELATARMMRAPSGSTLACCRSRSSSESELGIGTSIPVSILAAVSLENPPVSSRQDSPLSRPRRRTWPAGSWEAHGGAGFTLNGITADGDAHNSLIGGDALSVGERDALLELCRQRLDAFREHPDQRLGEVQGSPRRPAPHRSERQGGRHIGETNQQGVGVDG
jgi:hypothetical protein